MSMNNPGELIEIIKQVNDLIEGDLTDQDKLAYVNQVIKGVVVHFGERGASAP